MKQASHELEDQGVEIEPRKARIGPSSDSGGRCSPLATCPEDRADRFRRRAKLAATSQRAAIELKWLECCAWDRPGAKRCQIVSFPLWALSRGIFRRRRTRTDQEREAGIVQFVFRVRKPDYLEATL